MAEIAAGSGRVTASTGRSHGNRTVSGGVRGCGGGDKEAKEEEEVEEKKEEGGGVEKEERQE